MINCKRAPRNVAPAQFLTILDQEKKTKPLLPGALLLLGFSFFLLSYIKPVEAALLAIGGLVLLTGWLWRRLNTLRQARNRPKSVVIPPYQAGKWFVQVTTEAIQVRRKLFATTIPWQQIIGTEYRYDNADEWSELHEYEDAIYLRLADTSEFPIPVSAQGFAELKQACQTRLALPLLSYQAGSVEAPP